MLSLKNIELQGFKSFPDKTVIEFARGITAIVGPNGSGKSNIADALRWVMGETSTKSLRGSKMEDVIFDGTKSRPALGFAQVSMTFDNSGKELKTDFTEVTISRRYYRSGLSDYYINGASVRLRDIQGLLRDTGLGKDGYSIISQGAVTDIINSKSLDRRELFEEAAGISGFKFRRDESLRKLSLTNDNLIRLGDIASELSGRLPSLEKQAEKARKYITLRNEKKLLDIGLWLYDDIRLTSDIAAFENALATLSSSLSDNAMRMAFIADESERASEKSAGLTAAIEELRNDTKAVNETVSRHSGRIMVIENDIAHAKADIKRLNDDISAAEQEIRLAEAEKSKAYGDIESTDRKIAALNAEKAEILTRRAAEEEKEKEFYEESGRLNTLLAKMKADISAAAVSRASTVQRISDASERTKTLAEDKTDAEERLRVVEGSLAACNAETEELTKKIGEQNNIINGQSIKCRLQKQKLDTVTALADSIRTELNGQTNRLTILKDMEKSNEGFTGSVNAVLREAQRGVLNGIRGTVAQLLTVPSQYATAIETALGGAIQNIVTATENDAKNAIYYLKTRNAGRATFLPVSTIKGKRLEARGIEACAGYIGAASDLCSFDDEYRGIAESLLGRTAVADTLDNAANIAKKYGYSFRLVTLDGQLVNAGGSMTGGSTAKGTGVFTRRNEIEALSVSVSEKEAALTEKSKEQKAAETEYNRLSSLLTSLKEEANGLEKQLISAKSAHEHNIAYAAEIKRQLASIDSDMKKNAELLKELTKEANDLSRQAEALTEQESELLEKTEKLNTSHSELKAIQDELNAELHKKELEILSAENEKNNTSASMARSEDTVRLAIGKKAEITARINELTASISAFEDEKAALHKENLTATDKARENEEAINKKLLLRQKEEKKEADNREEEKRLYAEKETLIRESEKSTAAKNQAIERLKANQTRLWDEYEVTPSEARTGYSRPDNISEAQSRATELKNMIRALGEVHTGAIEEYTELKARYEALAGQIADLTEAKQNLEKLIMGLEEDMRRIFTENFRVIADEFSRVFRILFNGGEAKLTLSEGDDVLLSGVDIYAAPPGKIIKNMASLSGGEQAFTAICLYFAIMKIHPAPFCLLDEIESSLDDVNVVRFAEYLYNLTENTQIIAITHRRGTMEAADRLYGVTMREKGISKIITINVSEIEDAN